MVEMTRHPQCVQIGWETKLQKSIRSVQEVNRHKQKSRRQVCNQGFRKVTTRFESEIARKEDILFGAYMMLARKCPI